MMGGLRHLKLARIILLSLVHLALIVIGPALAQALPANKMPLGVVGPEIEVKSPKSHQTHLSSETLLAAIFCGGGNRIMPESEWRQYPHIIMAIYEDGTLIWSDHHITGGPPYHMTKLPIEDVKRHKAKFDSTGLFGVKNVSYERMDSSSVRIFYRRADGYMQMVSSHELAEENPNLVEQEHDVRRLHRGESRGQILAKESRSYQEFRASWSKVKRSLLDILPPADADGVSTVTIQPGYFRIDPLGVHSPK